MYKETLYLIFEEKKMKLYIFENILILKPIIYSKE